MEQINYKEEYRKLFSAYRANLDLPDISARQTMKALVDKFPYCQPLQFMYAAGLRNNPQKFESHLLKISMLAPQRETLYLTIHHPESIEIKGTIIQPPIEEPEIIESRFDSDILAKKPVEQLAEEEPAVKQETDGGVEQLNHILQEDLEETKIAEHEPAGGIEETYDRLPEENDIPVNESISEIEEDESILADSIDSHDFFTIDQAQSDHITDLHEEQVKSPEINADMPVSQPSGEPKTISRYYDEKMPFTFLWWLTKTRKEHAHTYQPYISFKLDTSQSIRKNVSDELNQQIMENIFHLQIQEDDKRTGRGSQTVEFKVKRKDEELIEKFIKEDPQIRPMQPDKISTENMARKSSEDLNNVVSETLARIYTEQMLFDKAIDAYKKLSLKFPEKNAYFADQISNLEKKIN